MLKPLLLVLALLFAIPSLGHAQEAPVPTASPTAAAAPRRCTGTIPDSALMRVPVFATLVMGDSARFAIPPGAISMVQAAASRMLTTLGMKQSANLDSLAAGEPRIPWDSLGRGVAITWHRDGRLGWKVEENHDPSQPSSEKVALLFGRALDSARTLGETSAPWPAQFDVDSVVMEVSFEHPKVRPLWEVDPVKARVAIPLFSVAAPIETDVSVSHRSSAMYPARLLMSGVSGYVVLEFVVDTLGRADTLTMHDAWPAGKPRLTGKEASYYAELVASSRRIASNTRYVPGTIGGCKHRQVVQQPFTWTLR